VDHSSVQVPEKGHPTNRLRHPPQRIHHRQSEQVQELEAEKRMRANRLQSRELAAATRDRRHPYGELHQWVARQDASEGLAAPVMDE